MEFNLCPKCGDRAKLGLLGYRASCERCQIELAVAPITKGLQALVGIAGFIIIAIAQVQGTDQILAKEPDDVFWALFPFYMTVFAVVMVVISLINYIIRNYYSVYELPKNT